MINHGKDQGATHDEAGDKGGKGDPKDSAETQATAGDPRGGLPPRVIQWVTAERGGHRGTQLPRSLGETQKRRPKPWIKGPGSDENLPVINEPPATHALGLKVRGEEFTQVSVSPTTSALSEILQKRADRAA